MDTGIKSKEEKRMMILKEIKAEQEANRANIERLKADIDNLNCKGELAATRGESIFSEERRAAIKEVIARIKANETAIARKCSELYIAEVKARILRENAKVALFAEAYPVLLDIFKKYSGKPYGEKTREKIRLEAKAAGYSVYIGKTYYDRDTLFITEMQDGFTNPACVSCEAIGKNEAGKITSFVNDQNKLIFDSITASCKARYTEDAEQEARNVAEAIKDYSEATKALEAKRRALAAILPEGISEPEYIKEYHIIF